MMKVLIDFEGDNLVLDVMLPTTALIIKQQVSQVCNIPVAVLNLYDYPHQIPSLRPLADNLIFGVNMENEILHLVLTFCDVHSSWAYFYVLLPRAGGGTTVEKFGCHRLRSIAEVKQSIFTRTGIPTNTYGLSRVIDGNPLNENLNLFGSPVMNGTVLYTVPP